MFLKCSETNCPLTPLLKIKNSNIFEIECNNGHKTVSNNLNTFLKSEEIDFQCSIHKRPYTDYCKNCKKDICTICLF